MTAAILTPTYKPPRQAAHRCAKAEPAPFALIYAALAAYPSGEVEAAIGVIVRTGKSVTTLLVREVLDGHAPPVYQQTKPLAIFTTPLPAVIPPPPVMVDLPDVTDTSAVRIAAELTSGPLVMDTLREKIHRCFNHAGLSLVEEAQFSRLRARWPHIGYWPPSNSYDAGCSCP